MILYSRSSRRLRNGWLLAVLLCGPIGGWAQSAALPAPMPEDIFPELKPILQTALQQSPTMIQRNLELAQSEAAQIIAQAQLLPIVGSGISYTVNEAAVSSDTSVSSRSNGFYYSVTVSQPVYKWGTLMAANNAAKIQVAISKRNYADAYRTLALTIRNQYLGLVAKKISARNAAAAQERAQYTLSIQEDNLKQGRISQSEILQPRLALEDARLVSDRYAEDFVQAKRVFARLTGQPELSDDRIPGEIPNLAFEPGRATAMLQQFLASDWERNLSVQMARDWVRVSELNYKQAKYRLYPMFSFLGSIAQSNSTNASTSSVSQVGVLSKYVGISASWTLFDGRATKGAQISARANQRLYERLLQNKSDEVLDQARSLEKQVGFSYRALTLAETRNAQNENIVKARQDEAKQGLASQVVVDTAIAQLDYSRLSVVNQRLDFLARVSEFSSLVGTDPVLQYVPSNLQSNVR